MRAPTRNGRDVTHAPLVARFAPLMARAPLALCAPLVARAPCVGAFRARRHGMHVCMRDSRAVLGNSQVFASKIKINEHLGAKSAKLRHALARNLTAQVRGRSN